MYLGSATGRIFFINENDLADLIASLPLDVVNQVNLVLEDPRRIVDFLLSCNSQARDKISIGNSFQSMLETLKATVDIRLANEEKPLEVRIFHIMLDNGY